MSARTLRQECQARLEPLRRCGLRIPAPLDAEELCRRLSRCLHQSIILTPVPMPPGAPLGLTLMTDSHIIIAVEAETSPVHRNHIAAHELGHVIFGHRPIEIRDTDAVRLLFPSLRPGLVRRVLNRTGAYTAIEEQQAETMASVLLELSHNPAPADSGDLDPTQVALRARLRTLEHPDR